MKVGNLGLLLVDSPRSKAYIQKLVKHSLIPQEAIFFVKEKAENSNSKSASMSSVENAIVRAFNGRKYFLYDPKLKHNAVMIGNYAKPTKYLGFDVDEPVTVTLEKHDIPYHKVRAPSINDQRVIETVRKARPEHLVFCGGGILRTAILGAGKKFIHIHPGKVPEYRGSHCIEWSVLEGNSCWASAIFMSEEIDEGDLIAQKDFPLPELENNNVAALYSSHIRSELLIKIVKSFVQEGSFPSAMQDPKVGRAYYKMHPALTNLVFHELRTGC